MIHTLHALFGPEDPARRQWLRGAGAVALGAAVTSAAAGPNTATAANATAPADAAAHPAEGILKFADARERFRALFRFERDWRDEGTALSCYQFLMYALPDGERPQPVVRFEGMEFS